MQLLGLDVDPVFTVQASLSGAVSHLELSPAELLGLRELQPLLWLWPCPYSALQHPLVARPALPTAQFSNHTGFPLFKGTVMDGEQLWTLIEGLEANGLIQYTHLLTGGFVVGVQCQAGLASFVLPACGLAAPGQRLLRLAGTQQASPP